MSAAEQVERMMRAGDFRYQKDLAAALGVTPGDLSAAKNRRTLPNRFLHPARERLGLEIRWIRTGEGTMYVAEDPRRAVENSVCVKKAVREKATDNALLAARLEHGMPEHAILDRPVTVDSPKILECTALAMNRLYETSGRLTVEAAASELAMDVAALLHGDISPERRQAVLTNAVALVGV